MCRGADCCNCKDLRTMGLCQKQHLGPTNYFKPEHPVLQLMLMESLYVETAT